MNIKTFLIALTGIFIFNGCTINIGSQTKVHYTHLPPEGKNIPVKPFRIIIANGCFNIILNQGNEENLVVKDDYPDDLIVSNVGDTLTLNDTNGNHTSHITVKTNIYITFRQLKSISTTSVGKIKTVDAIKGSNFSFHSDGVGENTLIIDADTVEAFE